MGTPFLDLHAHCHSTLVLSVVFTGGGGGQQRAYCYFTSALFFVFFMGVEGDIVQIAHGSLKFVSGMYV